MEQGHFAAMNTLYDAIVVGAGPAGLTAAMYLARSNRRILVLEKGPVGGQITLTHEVENFPALEKLSGQELAEKMQRQAEAFGAEILTAEVTGFDLEGAIKILRTSRGDFFCRGVVLATGAKPKPVGFSGEETFKGRGVSWCAVCDGRLFTGRDVFVVGGGYSAAEESLFLAEFARHVTVLIRKSDFACPKSVSAPVKNHKKITVLTNTVLEEVSGEDYVNFLRYKNTATGEVTVYSCQEPIGVFVFAGYSPATEALADVITLNEKGYILTDERQKANLDGVYAAGDVCEKPLRQLVTATADGAIAAAELEKYLMGQKQ